MDIVRCLEKLRPGEQWSLDGDTYEGLVWHDSTTKPTFEELEAIYPTVSSNQEKLNAIIQLERQITIRRQREAILGIDNGWLANIEQQIQTLRAQLK